MDDTQPMYGKPIISWETWEYPKHERSVRWYLIAGTVGAALLIYAILTASFPFAVVILMIGIISLLNHLRDPQRITIHVTTNGIVIGQHFYAYKEVKNFSIVYEPPQVKLLYLDFVSVFHPLISIPIEDVDPNELRSALMPYVLENLYRTEETLTDVLRRVYKL